MSILLTAANLIPPRGGAERSLFALAKRLGKDFGITILTPSNKNFIIPSLRGLGYSLIAKKKPFYVYLLKGFLKINVQNWWWRRVLKQHLEEPDTPLYDMIMTQGILTPSLFNLKTEGDKVIFIRSISFFVPQTNVNPLELEHKDKYFKHLNFLAKLQYPLVNSFRKKCLSVLNDKSNTLISNSEFMQEVTNHYTGRKSHIVYPPINPKEYKMIMDKGSKYILFINPTVSKGVDLMYQIARNLPDKHFLVVGKRSLNKRYYNLLQELKNVRVLQHKVNMKGVYKKTFLLVSPCRVPEGFGRTPIEAMVNGIPSVVPNRGGLPEAVGDAGDVVNDYEDVNEWIDKIKKYDDVNYYKKKSLKCKKRYKKFSLENQYKKLREIIKDLKWKLKS